MKIYVASSWRNSLQPDIVVALREADHEVYDFRNPKTGGAKCVVNNGFHWSDIDPLWKSWDLDEYLSGLDHPLAKTGFQSDFDSMKWADCCVLVLPCGRSAHLEAGFFVGAGKPLLILVSQIEPELMYKMADGVFAGFGDLLLRLEKLENEVEKPKTERRHLAGADWINNESFPQTEL